MRKIISEVISTLTIKELTDLEDFIKLYKTGLPSSYRDQDVRIIENEYGDLMLENTHGDLLTLNSKNELEAYYICPECKNEGFAEDLINSTYDWCCYNHFIENEQEDKWT